MSNIIIGMNDRALCLLKDQEYIEAHFAFQIAFKTVVTERSVIKNAGSLEVDMHSSDDLQWSDPFVYPGQGNNYVHSRAILIKGRPRDDADLPATILYNFALSFHLHSLSIGEPGNFIKNKALYLYKQALTLRPNPIIELAVLHNIGLVYHDFGNYKQSKQCFMRLATRMKGLRNSTKIGSTEDLQKMYLNIMCMNEPKMAAAA